MKQFNTLVILWLNATFAFAQLPSAKTKSSTTPDSIAVHKVVLDNENKLVSWIGPPEVAYDKVLHLRWDFIKNKVPNSPGPKPRSLYPQYYFYCAFKDSLGTLKPDTWMNDVGEKIPNWFESARLYYAYTGDPSVMKIVKGLIDYLLEHGTSPYDFAWPNMPYTTTNAGDLEFRGFTSSKSNQFALHEIQVDHASECGLTYFRMYLYSGDDKYKQAAIKVANTLASKVRTGSATRSPLPYRVIMKTGEVTAEYGANWTGAYMLFDNLINAGLGEIVAFKNARSKIRDFLLEYPLKTGYWTDGHSDNPIDSHTYKSNLSASNFGLYLFDHPELSPSWKTDQPMLIKWTEDNFVFRGVPGEPATQWGANIVGEQDIFLPKMDYQTARYAAQCARWYAVSGDESYREKAYRSLNWVTYCMDSVGKVFESPVSNGVLSWWSDCYGEGPRMFYQVFAAVPEWAPHGSNHILYSPGILKNVVYREKEVKYTACANNDMEYLRLAFKPKSITLNGIEIPENSGSSDIGYIRRPLGEGDYSLIVKRNRPGKVVIKGK